MLVCIHLEKLIHDSCLFIRTYICKITPWYFGIVFKPTSADSFYLQYDIKNDMPLSSRKEVAVYVHRKLLFRLRRLAIFFIVVTGILIYEISESYIAGYLALVGFILGFTIGYIVGNRMHKISWDEEASKVVGKMDRIGIIILIVYILFAITRRWIFSHWLQGYSLSAFVLSISCGAIISRLWFVRRKIRETLKRAGKLYPGKDDGVKET